MWVKICGTTNIEDALLAAEAGADALGFIFAESPRRVSVEQAREIARALPAGVQKVGVFVNASIQAVRAAVQEAELTGVQLHGDESAATVNALAAEGLVVVKALPSAELAAMADVHRALMGEGAAAVAVPQGMDALLIDSASRERRGGTGVPFVWGEVQDLVRELGRTVKIIIAGGLTPLNVREAIQRFEPWGVDVVSGVESAPGKKDPHKVREFVKLAKAFNR